MTYTQKSRQMGADATPGGRGMTKNKWGRWTLDLNEVPSLDICPYPEGTNYAYQVILFERGCTFGAFRQFLLRWTQHLRTKAWIAEVDVQSFVQAAEDLYNRENWGTK